MSLEGGGDQTLSLPLCMHPTGSAHLLPFRVVHRLERGEEKNSFDMYYLLDGGPAATNGRWRRSSSFDIYHLDGGPPLCRPMGARRVSPSR